MSYEAKSSVFTLILTLIILAIFYGGCTEQSRIRQWGSDAEMKLTPCTKLVNMDWKGSDLWFLTRPMRDGEKAETWTFDESSDWGLWKGKVTIVEQSCGLERK